MNSKQKIRILVLILILINVKSLAKPLLKLIPVLDNDIHIEKLTKSVTEKYFYQKIFGRYRPVV